MTLVVNVLWPRRFRHGAKDVGHTYVGRCLALFGSWGQRAFAHSLHAPERPRKYGPHGELFFFPLKKEPMVLGELIEFGVLHLSRNSESMCLDRSAHDG